MDVGHIIDYIITYNEMHKEEFEPQEKRTLQRDATTADWNRLFGG